VTLSDNRTRATRRLAAALRWSGALVAAGALVALGLVNPSHQAQAASTPSGYDQMSGVGNTASFITVPWTTGLLNSSNQAISAQGNEINPNADRQGDTGPTQFMDSDFSGLKVTVSQTQDIGHGGITVSWKWPGHATPVDVEYPGNYLQIMECYGNAPTGPTPEDCEFGQGVVPSGAAPLVAQRQGDLCSSNTIDPTGHNPTGSMNGLGPSDGCDPYEPANPVEPTTAGTPTHYPCTVQNGQQTDTDCLPDGFSIPFVPVGGGDPLYQKELPQAFDRFSTNEIDFATTGGDGNGQQQFETLTDVQSSGLGCGQPQADGSPQGCWLVIVPRGSHEPNGFQANIAVGGGPAPDTLVTSPLSAVNWAQRIQVHLDYAPLPTFCPLGGRADESLMEGSQLVTRAVQSWELKLNQDAQCSRIYHLAETSEQQVTNDFVLPVTPGVPANALAFTTDPVGADRLRSGQSPPTLPKIVYAPVAVMALDFGFHIDEAVPGDTAHVQGYLSTPVNMSPQLAARALTQVYRYDLPDYDPSGGLQGPAWSQNNPPDISRDPTFQQLNPEVIPHPGGGISLAPLDTVDHSAYYQQVWQWLQADPSTAAWLNGTANPADKVTIDPSYSSQKLGTPPAIDSMPRSYPCQSIQPPGVPTSQTRCSTDVAPYVIDFDAASAAVLSANPLTYGLTWDPTSVGPNGQSPYWAKNAPEPPGGTFIWTMDATPYLAAYGIVPAALCNDPGSSCVTPTVASVGAALANAKPDSDGLLEVNPANPGAGAYPLTDVIYAAVRTDASAQELTDYADFISFAANQGQTPGQAGGDLPAGYLPLTTSLQAQANAVVAQLRQIAAGGPTSTPTPTVSSSSSRTPAGGPSTGGTSGSTGAGSGGTQPSATPNSPASTGTPNGTTGTSPASTASTCAPSTTPTVTPTPSVTPTATASTTTPTVTPTGTASTCAPTGPVIAPPTVQLAAGTTPSQPVGPIRQVLVIVVIVGIAGAGGGILLRRGRLPSWPGRSRP
jgi:hypothetical protein